MAQDNPFDGDIEALRKALFPACPNPPPAKPKVTIGDIIRRGTCYVSFEGKAYRIEVKEVEYQ